MPTVCEEWETPYVLQYDVEIKRWRMSRTTINGDMGYMKSEIVSKAESWLVTGDENVREDYRAVYTMVDGHCGIGNDFLKQWFAANEKVEINQDMMSHLANSNA